MFGFTATALAQLKPPIFFHVGKTMKTLSSSAGVGRAIVEKCLGRMRAWVTLAVSAIEAEFPHFEICLAIEIFNLKGVGPSPDRMEAHFKILPHAYQLDLSKLRAQWEDLYPRAQMEYKHPLAH